MKNENLTKKYSIFLTADKCEISGVEGILSLSESEIALTLSSSTLFLSGENLNMDSLDTENGEAKITGNVREIKHKRKGEKLGFFKKLTK
ncbi:MAG: YabP/YqfC family sporulation protein [Clostridia bacterium]|nr:YabP/YqfC family sporulation protein [Clostridia bacterium]